MTDHDYEKSNYKIVTFIEMLNVGHCIRVNPTLDVIVDDVHRKSFDITNDHGRLPFFQEFNKEHYPRLTVTLESIEATQGARGEYVDNATICLVYLREEEDKVKDLLKIIEPDSSSLYSGCKPGEKYHPGISLRVLSRMSHNVPFAIEKAPFFVRKMMPTIMEKSKSYNNEELDKFKEVLSSMVTDFSRMTSNFKEVKLQYWEKHNLLA